MRTEVDPRASGAGPPGASAEKGGDRRFLRDAGAFVGASWVGQLVGTVRGFGVAAILSPERYGLFQLAMLAYEYARSSHLGTLHGMNKAVSRALGASDSESLHRSKDTAFTSAMGLAILTFACLPIHAWLRPEATVAERLAVAGGLAASAVYRFFNFHVALLRAGGRIPTASGLYVAFNLLYGAAALLGAWLGGPVGVWLAFVGSYGVVGLVAFYLSPWKFRLRWDLDELARLLRRGVPVVGVTFLGGVVASIDKLLVGGFYGVAALGIYSLAKRAAGLAASVAESVRWVTLPTFLEDAGAKCSGEQMRTRLLELCRWMSFLLPPLLATAALVVGYPIRWYLPAYLDAVSPARILLLGAGFFSLAGIPRSFLVALDREVSLVLAQIVVLATVCGLATLAHRGGFGPSGVAMAAVVSQALYASLVLAMAFRATDWEWARVVRATASLLLCPVLVMTTAALALHLNGPAVGIPGFSAAVFGVWGVAALSAPRELTELLRRGMTAFRVAPARR